MTVPTTDGDRAGEVPGSGIDQRTIAAYDQDPASFADDWHDQPPPTDLHDAALAHFTPGPTADVGCGSGREVAWLAANGFPTVGYDASAGLLAEARRRYPDLEFRQAALPALDGAPVGTFANVLCETVIMHLPAGAIGPSVARLVELLAPGGTLYLTWRVTEGADHRDALGRRYGAFADDVVLDVLARHDVTLLVDEDVGSTSSGKRIRRIVGRRA